MGIRDERVDDYIAKSPEFARPILDHLREVVHEACPEVEEALKWSRPSFLYRGLLCGMAAFKGHCTFDFWKHPLLVAEKDSANGQGMGQFGRITTLSDLPGRAVLMDLIRKAKALNEAGIKVPARSEPRKAQELIVPDDLRVALERDRKALATFEGFSPSNKREYLEWITEAKTPATRTRRLGTAVEWMAEGKPRNWKYLNC